jgi:hypothetical protein
MGFHSKPHQRKARSVSVGLPGFVNNLVVDAIDNIGKVLSAAGKLFGDPKESPADHTNQVLSGPPAAPASLPTPNGDSGLNSGATKGQRFRLLVLIYTGALPGFVAR